MLISADKLTKHFPIGGGQVVHAVDDVSLTIAEREVVGLVGESGSGKSTFGKTLIGLHDKTSGTVRVSRRDACRRSTRRRLSAQCASACR